MPQIRLSSGNLTIGSVAGRNEEGGNIVGIEVRDVKFKEFDNYRYLGGITGENRQEAVVQDCVLLDGAMEEAADSSAPGNCYGGIAGVNSGKLEGCRVENFTCSITGIYTATSTSAAKEKEELSSHVGGIAGKNGGFGEIKGCVIGGKQNAINAGSGMAGGIAGYNGGTIELSGDETATGLMLVQSDVTGLSGGAGEQAVIQGRVGSIQELVNAAKAGNISADSQYVEWDGGKNVSIETLKYSQSKNKVSSGSSPPYLRFRSTDLRFLRSNAPSNSKPFRS